MQRAARSLKSRALQLLAQRDQSRQELRTKLLRHARAAAQNVADDGDSGERALAEVESLLDWLEANGFLSDARFAESRVQARQSRFGRLRIESELGRHRVELPAELATALAASELERAAAVRARRFARPPADASEHAAQSRFLLARGFAPELVRRLLRSVGRAPVGIAADDAG